MALTTVSVGCLLPSLVQSCGDEVISADSRRRTSQSHTIDSPTMASVAHSILQSFAARSSPSDAQLTKQS